MLNPKELLGGEHVAHVRFGRGVVGNNTYGFGAAAIACAFIAWSLKSEPLLALLSGAGILGVYLVYMFTTQRFAANHPDLAMLGGSEWLRFQEQQTAIKGLPVLPAAPLVIDPEADGDLPAPGRINGV